MLENSIGANHLAYWQDNLKGELPLLDLHTTLVPSSINSLGNASYNIKISKGVIAKLKEKANKEGVSLFIMLLGTYKVLLHRYTLQNDIIVGVPVAGRPNKKFLDTIGYFINMAPLRSNIDASLTFAEFVAELKYTVIKGLEHSVYPFPKLVSALKKY